MRVEEDTSVLIFKFSFFKSLVVDKIKEVIKYQGDEIPFSSVKGYWKNYRVVRRKKVYYVMLLTSQKMFPITPHIDEYDADEVLNGLRKLLPREVKK